MKRPFMFIFFAEDSRLLPANSTELILEKQKVDIDFGDERPLYNIFKQYFTLLDKVRQGAKSRGSILFFIKASSSNFIFFKLHQNFLCRYKIRLQ